MSYKFKEFMVLIDTEVLQRDRANIQAITDKNRKADRITVIHWINQGLSYLHTLNPDFWYRVEDYTVPIDTDRLELPFYWRNLDEVIMDRRVYNVGSISDNRHELYAVNSNTIAFHNKTFESGSQIQLVGTFKPKRLTAPLLADYASYTAFQTALDSVDEEYIDIDDSFIELLKLKVLMSYSGMMSKDSPNWLYEYRRQKLAFEEADPPSSRKGGMENTINYGRMSIRRPM